MAEPDFAPVEITPPTPLEGRRAGPRRESRLPEAETPSRPQQKNRPGGDFSALLNKLTKPPPPPKNTRRGAQRIVGIGAQTAMAAELSDAAAQPDRGVLEPAGQGLPNADELVVDFDLFLNPDGSVAQPPQLSADSARAAAGDPFTRAAAEAARRAIYQCAPYHLPQDRYSQWREINPMHFDPRQMMGQ